MVSNFDPSGVIIIGLIFLAIAILTVFGRVSQGNSLLHSILKTWFWIILSLYFFYAGFGFKYYSIETIGVTRGTDLIWKAGCVVKFEYQYENVTLNSSESRPAIYSNLNLINGKYKVRVYNALFWHVTRMDFTKPVE